MLRLLRHTCAGTVQLACIDPPYNRGHDRAYPDDYRAPRDPAARKSASATGGRLHARWLDLMAPRLVLARELLSEDGILAVSIDELEVARLRLLLEEIFGESNFVAEIVVGLNPKGRQLAPFFATAHEYLLVFARDVRRTALVAASKDEVDPITMMKRKMASVPFRKGPHDIDYPTILKNILIECKSRNNHASGRRGSTLLLSA